jgi:large subunit ribosomal protein L9
MEVVLLERVEKLGQMGDVVRVKNGYGRNFLLPRGKALRATKQNMAQFETQRAQLETRNLEERKEAEQVAEKMNGTAFVVIRQSSEAGMLYGSVSTRDVATHLTEAGFSVNKGQVVLERPIKQLGLYEIRITLHPEVTATVTANVSRSEEEAERQARGEDVFASAHDEDDDEDYDAAEIFEDGDDAPEGDAGEESADSEDAAEDAKDD